MSQEIIDVIDFASYTKEIEERTSNILDLLSKKCIHKIDEKSIEQIAQVVKGIENNQFILEQLKKNPRAISDIQEELIAQNQKLESQIQELKQLATEEDARLLQQKTQLENELSLLNQEMEKLNQAKLELSEELQTKKIKEQIALIQNEINDLNRVKLEMEEELLKVQQELQLLTNEKMEKENTINQVKGNVEQMKIQLQEQIAQLEKLQEQSQIQDLVGLLVNLNNLITSVNENKSVISQVTDLKVQIDEIQKQQNDQFVLLQKEKESLAILTQTLSELKSQKGSLQEIEEVKKQIEMTNVQIEEFKNQIAMYEILQKTLLEKQEEFELRKQELQKVNELKVQLKQVEEEIQLVVQQLPEDLQKVIISAQTKQNVLAEITLIKNDLIKKIQDREVAIQKVTEANLLQVQVMNKEKEKLVSEIERLNQEKLNNCEMKLKDLDEMRDEVRQLFELTKDKMFSDMLVKIDSMLNSKTCTVEMDKEYKVYQKQKFKMIVEKLGAKDNSEVLKKLKSLWAYEENFNKCLARYNDIQKIVPILNQIVFQCEKIINSDKVKPNDKDKYQKVKQDSIQLKQQVEQLPKPKAMFNLKNITEDTNLEELFEKYQKYDTNQICEAMNKFPIDVKRVNQILQDAINFTEDALGAVRVYVRVNNIHNVDKLTIDKGKIPDKMISLNCAAKSKEFVGQFGPFYGVFYSDKNVGSNEEIFCGSNDLNRTSPLNYYQDKKLTCPKEEQEHSPGIRNLIQQIQSGYHICMFGYGYSGSGKTFSLFGSYPAPGEKRTPVKGLTQIALEYFDKSLVTSIKFKAIYELYGKYDKSGTINQQIKPVAEEEIIIYYQDSNYLNRLSSDRIITRDEKIKSLNSINNDLINDVELLNTVIGEITEKRKKESRIKRTINNPESSRGHLFITIEFVFNDSTIGYLTVIDMAGVENPIEMYDTFFESFVNDITFTNFFLQSVFPQPSKKSKGIDALLDGQKSQINKYIFDIYKKSYPNQPLEKNIFTYKYEIENIQQGLYINETIQALKNFFQRKNGLKVTDEEYSNVSSITSVVSGINDYREDVLAGKIKFFNKDTLMGKILKSFENKQGKPTKFVMLTLMNPRTEDKYCESSYRTMQFAKQVASTS